MRSCRKPLVSIRFIFFFSAGEVLVLGVGLTQIYTEEWVITLHCPSLVHFSKLGHVPLGRSCLFSIRERTGGWAFTPVNATNPTKIRTRLSDFSTRALTPNSHLNIPE